MAVSRRLRYEVLRRDQHRCKYCGATADDTKITVDHVVATALGGSDDPSNLVAACADCNSGKSATPADAALVAEVDQEQARWVQAMNIALDQRAATLADERKRLARFDRKWRSYKTAGQHYPRDHNWKNSVGRFMAGGLDDQFLADAIDTAMGAPRPSFTDKWKYFCGICWRELDGLQQVASQVLVAAAPAQKWPAPRFADDEEPEMPLMEMVDLFVEELLTAMGATRQIQKLANHALWDGMGEANLVYQGRSAYLDPPEPGCHLDDAKDFLSGWSAPEFNRIRHLQRGEEDVDWPVALAAPDTQETVTCL